MYSLLLAALFTLPSQTQVNILTGNGNNDRTNSNLQEVQLSPATVNPSTFGKLGVFPVDSQVYAQPLHALIVVALGSSEYFHNAEAMAFAA
jgi:hypothetical protein